jgi:hypothetical protein
MRFVIHITLWEIVLVYYQRQSLNANTKVILIREGQPIESPTKKPLQVWQVPTVLL